MKEFYQKNRNNLLIIAILIGITFLAFYWTNSFFEQKKRAIIGEINIKKEKLSKIEALLKEINLQKNNTSKRLTEGLLTFIEKLNNTMNLSNKMIAIKPIENNQKEKIRVRYEKLTLTEIINILKKIESYANLNISYFKLEKNFENKKLANLIMEIEKIR